MNWYVVLLKMDSNHTDEVIEHLRKLPKNPTPDINLCYSYNVFGTWDACIWFSTNNQENAMNFVQTHIRNIPYVTETYTLPTTTIKEYK